MVFPVRHVGGHNPAQIGRPCRNWLGEGACSARRGLSPVTQNSPGARPGASVIPAIINGYKAIFYVDQSSPLLSFEDRVLCNQLSFGFGEARENPKAGSGRRSESELTAAFGKVRQLPECLMRGRKAEFLGLHWHSGSSLSTRRALAKFHWTVVASRALVMS
jgi:hypothetical protein